MVSVRASGFTLLEVLIAMAITAIIAALSFASIDQAMNSVEGLRRQGERVSELNRAWGLLTRDLHHFVSREVRNEFGGVDAPLMGGEIANSSLMFTRTGWHNTIGRVRSNMQRVRYILEDTTLYREYWLVLDRTSESEPLRVAVLEDVESIEFRFLPASFAVGPREFETDDWPEAWAVGGTGNGTGVPEAVEIRLTLEDWGEVRWLYELPQPVI